MTEKPFVVQAMDELVVSPAGLKAMAEGERILTGMIAMVNDPQVQATAQAIRQSAVDALVSVGRAWEQVNRR